jgi:hypothetical protein
MGKVRPISHQVGLGATTLVHRIPVNDQGLFEGMSVSNTVMWLFKRTYSQQDVC